MRVVYFIRYCCLLHVYAATSPLDCLRIQLLHSLVIENNEFSLENSTTPPPKSVLLNLVSVLSNVIVLLQVPSCWWVSEVHLAHPLTTIFIKEKMSIKLGCNSLLSQTGRTEHDLSNVCFEIHWHLMSMIGWIRRVKTLLLESHH